jgi:nucleoside-diphosphate-sugar epimerase
MKVLVTGATGFIGSYVINELLKKGLDVIATARAVQKAKSFNWFPDVRFVPYDFNDSTVSSLADHFHHPDKVIHLAWGGLPNYKQLFHFEDELPRQYAFIKKLVTEGIADITITGTCFEYGMIEGLLQEEMVTQPGNPYAFAKDALRKQLEFLQKSQPFQMKWVRLFYMYGAGQSASSVLSQLQQALDEGATSFNMSKGDQRRDYLPVTEVAANTVAIALQNSITGIINNSSGIPISIKQLVENYLAGNNQSIELNTGYYPYPDYEPFSFWGDNSKLKKILLNEPD